MRFSFVARLSLLASVPACLLALPTLVHAQDAADVGANYYYLNNGAVNSNLGWKTVMVGRDGSGNNYSNNITVSVTSGAVVENVNSFNKNSVSVVGGSVSSAYVFDASTLNISGGSLALVRANMAESSVNISGGQVTSLQHYGGTINISGGTIGDFRALNVGTFNWSGGTISERVLRLSGGVVNLYGSGLSFSSAGSGNEFGMNYTDYVLSGKLSNGQSVDGFIMRDIDGGNSVNTDNNPFNPSALNVINATAAPEPGSIALLLSAGVPVVGIVRRRRKY